MAHTCPFGRGMTVYFHLMISVNIGYYYYMSYIADLQKFHETPGGNHKSIYQIKISIFTAMTNAASSMF